MYRALGVHAWYIISALGGWCLRARGRGRVEAISITKKKVYYVLLYVPRRRGIWMEQQTPH